MHTFKFFIDSYILKGVFPTSQFTDKPLCLEGGKSQRKFLAPSSWETVRALNDLRLAMGKYKFALGARLFLDNNLPAIHFKSSSYIWQTSVSWSFCLVPDSSVLSFLIEASWDAFVLLISSFSLSISSSSDCTCVSNKGNVEV